MTTFVWFLVISMTLPEKWIVTIHTEKQWFDHIPAIVSNYYGLIVLKFSSFGGYHDFARFRTVLGLSVLDEN